MTLINTQSLSYDLTLFAILVGLVTYYGLQRKMPGYYSTKGARPSAAVPVDTLDLEGISGGLEEGIFTSEGLVDVWIVSYYKLI